MPQGRAGRAEAPFAEFVGYIHPKWDGIGFRKTARVENVRETRSFLWTYWF